MQENCDLDITLDFFLFFVFDQLFFSRSSKLLFFWFLCIYQCFYVFYNFGIDFSQIWCIQPIKPVLGPFFMVLRDLHVFYFWTRSGSNIEKQVLIFKALRKRNHKKRGKLSFLVTYKQVALKNRGEADLHVLL